LSTRTGIVVILSIGCGAPAPIQRVGRPPPPVATGAKIPCGQPQLDGAYPPVIVQLCTEQRDALAAELRAKSPYKLDIVRVDSFGEVQLYTSDAAILETPPPHAGPLRPTELAKLGKWATIVAGVVHVQGEPHQSQYEGTVIVENHADRTITIAATRQADRMYVLTVKTQLVATTPDADRAAALHDRLLGARYNHVVELDHRPCDPSGPIDNCPRGDVPAERTPVQLTASQIVTGTGTLELVRGRGAPREAHSILCADLSIAEPKRNQRREDDYMVGRTHYEPIGNAPKLPLVIDAVTGEDLTALVHTKGWANCVSGHAQGMVVDSPDFDSTP
jgi:hypothetical protein